MMKTPARPTRFLWLEWLTHALATRCVQFVLLPALVLIWFAWSDPSQGAADTLLRVQLWAQAVLITGVAYLVARGLSGRVRGEGLAEAAQRGSVSSGIAFAGLCVLRGMVLLGLLLFFAGSVRAEVQTDVRTEVPVAAQRLLPALREQIAQVWPDMPAPAYFGALIEHESCITLTHPRCWSPTSRLKTAREEGAGLGQITRAWSSSGRLRFDALTDVRRLDPKGLAELRWDTVYQRPDLQLRALVLTTRRTYGQLTALVPSAPERLAMTDAAYNGGLGGVLNERRACALRPGCDPNQWFGHVEHTCLKSGVPIGPGYGGRSACDINRHHVADVLQVRMPRYVPYLPAPLHASTAAGAA